MTASNRITYSDQTKVRQSELRKQSWGSLVSADTSAQRLFPYTVPHREIPMVRIGEIGIEIAREEKPNFALRTASMMIC